MIRGSKLYPFPLAKPHEAWAQGRIKLWAIKNMKTLDFPSQPHKARVSRTGVRTGLQLQGHRDMQGFNSSSLAAMMHTEAT